MRLIIVWFQLIIILLIGAKTSFSMNNSEGLTECLISSNCIKVEWSFNNLNDSYEKLIRAASELPRVTVIENKKDYWHGVVRSLIFRFPDDLEILRIPSKNIIQVKSASRIGLGDLGVNQQRINTLSSKLDKLGLRPTF